MKAQTLPMAVSSKPAATYKKIAWIVLAAVIIGLAVLGGLLAANWPFTRAAMTQRLEQASSAKVEMRGFRSTYFPYPGCIAEGVVFRKSARGASQTQQSQPLITIQRLTIQSTYPGLFSTPKRIRKLIADGLRIDIPPGGTTLSSSGGSNKDEVVIGELLADNAVLALDSASSQQKLTFPIHHIRFLNISAHGTIPFQVSLQLPMPRGEVESSGWIGPWKDAQGVVRSTPISGGYTLKQADLGIFSAVRGKVSSRGEFSGTLERLNVSGSTESPDFEVTDSGHSFHLSTQFRGVVDLKTGDVVLPSLNANFGKTHLVSALTVSGKPKTVELNVTQGKGQIQDLVLLISHGKSAIVGPISFHTKVVLPPERRPFKERVRLMGDFNIDPASFPSPNTQKGVDQLSERAQGEKDKNKDFDADDDTSGFEKIISNLKGQVLLKDGMATFPDITFAVPGAKALGHGNYSLITKQVNFHGTMRMQATVSQATTGAKSVFLKVLDPFFKKKHAGSEIKVAMTGTYDHTHFSAGLK
ncbi:MAG TPA: hypothetical protein VGK24_20035 [Candidatus Angelobacter sp.]